MNLDPTWTQAWSSVIALLIAVGVPVYQQHKVNQRENERIKSEEKLKHEQIDMLKFNIRNFLIHSEYESSNAHYDEINIFNKRESFDRWLAKGLSSNYDPNQRKILLFGQSCLTDSYNADGDHYPEIQKKHLEELKKL